MTVLVLALAVILGILALRFVIGLVKAIAWIVLLVLAAFLAAHHLGG